MDVTLRRIHPEKNMRRFYRLVVQPDLFGALCLICEWGRIGRAGGQTRIMPYATPAEAQAAFDKQRTAKEKKGYVPVVDAFK